MRIFSMVSRLDRQVKVFSALLFWLHISLPDRGKIKFYFQLHGCGKIPIWIYSYRTHIRIKSAQRSENFTPVEVVKWRNWFRSSLEFVFGWSHKRPFLALSLFTRVSQLDSLHTHALLSFFWYIHAPCILKSDFGLIFSHPQVSTGRQSPTHGCMTHLTPPNHPQKERKNEENSTTINGIAPRYWEHAYTKVCKLGLCCCFVFTSMDFSSRFESSCVYPE